MKQTYQQRFGHDRVRKANKNSKKFARQQGALARMRTMLDGNIRLYGNLDNYWQKYTKSQIAVLEAKGVN